MSRVATRITRSGRMLEDAFFRKAKAAGFVARSAYKLEELQRRFRLIPPRGAVLDLGCHPGAWLQVACRELGPRGGAVVGVDINAAVAVPQRHCDARVRVLCADARDLTPENWRELIPADKDGFDAVLSDMCHATLGAGGADAARSAQLVRTALDVALGEGWEDDEREAEKEEEEEEGGGGDEGGEREKTEREEGEGTWGEGRGGSGAKEGGGDGEEVEEEMNARSSAAASSPEDGKAATLPSAHSAPPPGCAPASPSSAHSAPPPGCAPATPSSAHSAPPPGCAPATPSSAHSAPPPGCAPATPSSAHSAPPPGCAPASPSSAHSAPPPGFAPASPSSVAPPPDSASPCSPCSSPPPSERARRGVLAYGGNVALKILQGPETPALGVALRRRFAKVAWLRPQATRSESSETYLVGLGRLTDAERRTLDQQKREKKMHEKAKKLQKKNKRAKKKNK